jgi:ribonuclease P protein component
MTSNGFTTEEHLKSKKRIEQIFSEGKSLKAYPLLAVYVPLEASATNNQAGFSVSKKKFKRAVDRNLLKRRMREAYRLNKALLTGGSQHLAIMFIYMPKEIQSSEQISKGMQKTLSKLAAKKQG